MYEKYVDYEGSSRQMVSVKTQELESLQDYRLGVFHLIQAVKQQVAETDSAAELGIRRSQQYRDRFAENVDYLPKLEHTYKHIKELMTLQECELKGLREAENVARIDHPRHAELAWSFCYTDSCSIHISSKQGSGYWPKKKKAVYWDQKPRYSIAKTADAEADQQSKN